MNTESLEKFSIPSNEITEKPDPIAQGEKIFAERNNSNVIANELKGIINQKTDSLLFNLGLESENEQPKTENEKFISKLETNKRYSEILSEEPEVKPYILKNLEIFDKNYASLIPDKNLRDCVKFVLSTQNFDVIYDEDLNRYDYSKNEDLIKDLLSESNYPQDLSDKINTIAQSWIINNYLNYGGLPENKLNSIISDLKIDSKNLGISEKDYYKVLKSIYLTNEHENLSQLKKEQNFDIEDEFKPLEEALDHVPPTFARKELLEGGLSDENINKSVDEYLNWKNENEFMGGILEPGRIGILTHATPINSAVEIIKEGSIKSMSYMLLGENPRADLGNSPPSVEIGKATEKFLEGNSNLQKFVLDNYEKIGNYFTGEDKENYLINAKNYITDYNSFIKYLETFTKDIDSSFSGRKTLTEKKRDLRLVFNILPKEDRKLIINNCDSVIPEISFQTSNVHLGYTGDEKDPSKQAVFIVDYSSVPKDDLVRKDRYQRIKDDYFETKRKEMLSTKQNINTVDELQLVDSKNLNRKVDEYGNVFYEQSSKVGYELNINKGLMLFPKSQENKLTGLNTKNVYFFDDSKFKNVDEALGWLVTTPEGQAIYNNILNTSSI